jgi:hypothetical protein
MRLSLSFVGFSHNIQRLGISQSQFVVPSEWCRSCGQFHHVASVDGRPIRGLVIEY